MRDRTRLLSAVAVMAIGAGLCVAVSAGPAAAGPPPDIGGDLFFVNSNPLGQNPGNVYNVDPTTAEATPIVASGVNGPSVAAAESPLSEVIFASRPFGLLEIDTDGAGTHLVPSILIQGLAWDPTGGTLYGSFGTIFFTIHPETGATSQLPPPPANLITGLAWRDGLVYALDVNGVLLSFDPNGQTWNEVGQTELGNPGDNGLAWNPTLDVFYAIDSDGDLYSLDPSDAATTHVGDTGVGVGGGLAFVPFQSDTQPDGRIRNASGGGDVGNDVYGVEQTVTRITPEGVRTEHLVKFQNDGSQHQAYVVTGEPGDPDWRVRYHVRGEPVTGAVVDGSYVTRVLAPGEIFRMRVRVKPLEGAALDGDGFAVDVSAANGDTPALTDTVRAVTLATT